MEFLKSGVFENSNKYAFACSTLFQLNLMLEVPSACVTEATALCLSSEGDALFRQQATLYRFPFRR